MPAVADVVRELVVADVPVIFLDTCDLLHVVRAIPRGLLRYPVAAVRLLDALRLTPPACRLVVSHHTRTEWVENHPSALEESRKHLADLEGRSTAFHDTREILGIPAAFPRAGYSTAGVADGLFDLSKALVDLALEIDRDEDCLLRATDRVLSKKPPSRKGGEFTDCAILEQSLAVSRGLRAAGFARKLVFCTSNDRDYQEARSLHPALSAEFASVPLIFKPNLEGAVGELLR